ncbi:MAG: hypothetical protein L6Q99_20025 [Planctomycetes bacterium]|nr:hypothetical protein [Planctomycetota bacterium]
MRSSRSMRHVRRALSFAAVAATAGAAQAQTVFSIEYRSPTIAVPNTCTGVPITEGDLLVAATPGGVPALGPLPPPCIFITGGAGGLGLPMHAGCVGHPPGLPCGVEVDALSFGTDGPLLAGMPPGRVAFSVDRFASAPPATPMPPNVGSEGAFGAREASADVFVDLGLPAGPIPPAVLGIGHTGLVDGNGLMGPSAFAYPGLGLIEPLPPGCGMVDPGDNVDAVDVDGPLGSAIAFFSLDAAFVDPLCGIPYSGSAAANGFLPGMILAKPAAGLLGVYAMPPMLGLDFVGPGTDDLDALAIFENGAAGFQPSPGPYMGWGGAADMVLFSVRRGSAVIGMPDSIFGAPIEPGDILIPPVAGGVSPFPGILFSAESLGLLTARSFAVAFGAELDALDIIRQPLVDCNANGIDDAVEIAMGAPDCNNNGLLDKCEWSGTTNYCTGKVNSNGCVPAISFAGPDMVSIACAAAGNAANIMVTNLSPRPAAVSHIGQLFYSTTGPAAVPFLGGTLCVKGPIKRIPPLVNTGGTVGSTTLCDSSITQDFNARIASGVDPALVAGAQVWVQGWARDTAAFLGVQLSDALTFTIAP